MDHPQIGNNASSILLNADPQKAEILSAAKY